MSIYKKLSLLERLKELFKSHYKDDSTSCTVLPENQSTPSKQSVSIANETQSKALGEKTTPITSVVSSHTYSKSPQYQDFDTTARSKSKQTADVSSNGLKSSHKKSHDYSHNKSSQQASMSNQPITDVVLAFLDSNELVYRHHSPKPSYSTDIEDNNSNPAKKDIHHISMAMRHHIEREAQSPQENDWTQETISLNNPDADIEDNNGIEWICVIRIHEHTQLIAIYGITMMSAIYPLFKELIDGQPNMFELETLLEQYQGLEEETYLLASKTIQ